MPVGVNRTKLPRPGGSIPRATVCCCSGEGMCTASVNLSPELTPAQLFDEATDSFRFRDRIRRPRSMTRSRFAWRFSGGLATSSTRSSPRPRHRCGAHSAWVRGGYRNGCRQHLPPAEHVVLADQPEQPGHCRRLVPRVDTQRRT
jgi:hypothetical protein